MSAVDTRFRRNFVVASALHVAVIGGILLWESFFSEGSKSALASVQLVTPADLFGELPKGDGHGRGAYKAPPGADTIAGPNEAMSPTDESAAPEPKAVSLPKADPNEIAIPKKQSAKKPAPKPTPASSKKPMDPKPVGATRRTPATGESRTANANDIRQRFARALTSAENGTPYGDNKPAGGGNATAGRIGSPTGSPNGIPGGIGSGSPFWEYYQHVHDQMYEAWEQPGQVVDKKLIATVMIRVARDGTVTDVSLRNSSGNKLMDESALAAAHKVPRLEPPPDALVKDSTANITVDFQVEG